MTTILWGVVGSTAYGLATPDSDRDEYGIHVAPTREVLTWGVKEPTRVTHEPDSTSHEIGKYLSLALKGNPTVLEALYLEEYTTLTDCGEMLIANRSALLSGPAVLSAYSGYAMDQMRRHIRGTAGRMDKRRPKHIRHCLRLLIQAEELLTEGTLTLRMTGAQREFLFWVCEQDLDVVEKYFNHCDTEVKAAYAKTSLPEKPQRDLIASVLHTIRLHEMASAL